MAASPHVADAHACHVTDEPSAPSHAGYPTEHAPTYVSVSSPIPESARRASATNPTYPTATPVTEDAPHQEELEACSSLTSTIAAAALLRQPLAPLNAGHNAPSSEGSEGHHDDGGSGADAEGGDTWEEMEDRAPGRTAFIRTNASSTVGSVYEVGSPGTRVGTRPAMNATAPPAVGRAAPEEVVTIVKPSAQTHARTYALTHTLAAPRSPPAHMVVHRYTSDSPSAPVWGKTPVLSTRKAVQHEVLPPVSVAPKSKYDLLTGGISTTQRSSGTAPPAAAAATPATSVSVPLPRATAPTAPSSHAAVAAPAAQQLSSTASGATVTRAPVDSSSVNGSNSALAVQPAEDAPGTLHVAVAAADMRDLVSHVDRNSFGFELRDMFDRADFAGVLREVHSAARDLPQVQLCRRLFRIVAKNKEAMTVQDMYELLVVFTPCGVALREGADFYWEDCGGKSSLTFVDFLKHGSAMRARLHDYELFQQLSDPQKLVVMHARVLPGNPPNDANTSRLHVLKLADQQAQGSLPRHTRPLRLYEEVFLVDYQERLYEAALIPATEVPTATLRSDYSHEHAQQQQLQLQHPGGSNGHLPALPQLSVPVLLKEDMEWRHAEEVYVSESNLGGSAPPEEMHPSAARSSRGVDATRPPGKPGNSRSGSRGRQAALTQRTAAGSGGGAVTLYAGASGRRTGHGQGADQAAMDLLQQMRPQQQKNMGRFVEEEYWERRTMDDHLISQLQFMYTAQ